MAAASMASLAEVERVASAFDQAPLDPGRWNDALAGLASLTGSSRAELIGLSRENGFAAFDWISGDRDGLGDQALAIGAYDGGVNFRVAASFQAGEMTVVDERHYDAVRPRLTSDLYIEFSERTDIPFGCQTSLLVDPDHFVGLAILKSRADGRSSEDQRAAFAAVAPRVRAAVKLQMAMEAQGRQMVLGAFDAVSTKALLVDRHGRVQAVTPAADRLLSGTRRLSVAGGRIETPVPLETRRVAHALHAAVTGASREATIVLPPLAGSEPALRMEIRALPEQAWAMGLAPSAMVILRDGRADMGHHHARLRDTFGLTPAEADIALALARGLARADIARSRRVSIETIKTQLKPIYQKLGVSREAELVARITVLDGA
jgi:DNA-binding CsgD family transcriptional regulator